MALAGHLGKNILLDMKLIKSDPQKVITALSKRMIDVDLDVILSLDERTRDLQHQFENLRARRNELSRRIRTAKQSGEETDSIEAEAVVVNGELSDIKPQLMDAKDDLHEQLAALPNLPDDRVPEGGKESNKVVKVWGEKPDLPQDAPDHTEICQRLGLVDYARGVKLGGSGFWLYSGLGAALEWSLLDYFCKTHFRDGFEFLLPPHLLTHECGYSAGQFPKFKDDVFHLQTRDNDRERFLAPTAETAILSVYRDEILESEQLPKKCFAYTPCYRREAGGARTEERGTIRGHQFNKVEMFEFVAPADAERALEELVSRAENIVESLGLHYRTSLLAAGDTSASMALTYDVEVWIPSLQDYKEVSSISWAGEYQARRANIRYRSTGKKKNAFVHTLNGSGLATSRLLPAIVEQFQQPDGTVIIPEPLRPWVGCDLLSAS